LSEASTIVENSCAGPIGVPTGGANLEEFGPGCPGVSGNPELGPLQNNGGPTETMALGSGSAAIDKVGLRSCPETDQRGHFRPDSQETSCDIGAYELQDPTLIVCIPCIQVFTGLTVAPRFFGLKALDSERRGATVIAVLHKARILVLVVRKVRSRHRLALVGFVRLGHHHAGRSLIQWSLRVGGRLLPPGRYQVTMYALDNGDVLSPPANPGAITLIVSKDGGVRVVR
jgi:hypothetical protein